MKRTKSVCLIVLLLIGIASCDPGRIYDVSHAVEGGFWDRDSIFHYEIEIEDSLQLTNFFISIRNNTDYPYSNIYLFFC